MQSLQVTRWYIKDRWFLLSVLSIFWRFTIFLVIVFFFWPTEIHSPKGSPKANKHKKQAQTTTKGPAKGRKQAAQRQHKNNRSTKNCYQKQYQGNRKNKKNQHKSNQHHPSQPHYQQNPQQAKWPAKMGVLPPIQKGTSS